MSCEPGPGVTRREALCGLAGACALAALGCGGGAGHEGVGHEGRLELRLADYPALREVGGAAEVEVPGSFLHLVVAHRAPDQFVAVWRICTHGACAVEYRAQAGDFRCPCHGSRFGPEGKVLQGPATEPLRSFAVAREGDSLFVRVG